MNDGTFKALDYPKAFNFAVEQARRLNRPMGIESANEFGRQMLRVKMLPIESSRRFGWELRCEVVTGDMPLMVVER